MFGTIDLGLPYLFNIDGYIIITYLLWFVFGGIVSFVAFFEKEDKEAGQLALAGIVLAPLSTVILIILLCVGLYEELATKYDWPNLKTIWNEIKNYKQERKRIQQAKLYLKELDKQWEMIKKEKQRQQMSQ